MSLPAIEAAVPVAEEAATMLQVPAFTPEYMHQARIRSPFSDHGSHLTAPARSAQQQAELASERRLLALYILGWSEADPVKIAEATTARYEFHDPLVGRFSRRSLPEYFEHLQARFAVTGATRRRDVAFTLRGPMQGLPQTGSVQYWREAPHIGLTGVANIAVTAAGVAADAVGYDLNLACETLRG
jgi:hypothetical protein